MTISEDLRAELSAIYADLEAEIAGLSPSCQACGRCCDFGAYDHELWLTEIELAALVSDHGLKVPVSSQTCPYMDGKHCTARSGRALGCRTYFCRLPAEVVEELTWRYLERIRAWRKEVGATLQHGELLSSLAAAHAERAR